MSAQPSQVVDPKELPPLSDYEFNGDNCTVQRKCAFIQAFREEGSIFHAAQVCRMSRRTVYNWIEADEQFAEALADSKEDTYDKLETSVYKRAFSNDLLAMFYLKAHRPKFRDKVTIDVQGLQEEIDKLLAQQGQRQLPAAVTEFIDTSYSQGQEEYQPIHSGLDNQQKEDSHD